MSERPHDFSPADRALFDLARMVRDTSYRFVTPTPLTIARNNGRPGNVEAGSLADVFGWSRPFNDTILPTPMLDLMTAAGVLDRQGGGFHSTIRLSTLGADLFVHSAYPTTAADAVFFGPDTYRFTNAIAAHLALSRAPVRRAVDVGCGAGPGGVVVAKSRPGADVAMVDINDVALRYARVNAALAGAARASAHSSDLLTDIEGSFDLIVANPPYLIDPAERAYRHGGGALGEGLSLAILDAALDRLSPGGTLLLYTGSAIANGYDGFRQAASERLDASPHHWTYAETDPDVFGEELDGGAYAHADRIAAVVLTVTKEN